MLLYNKLVNLKGPAIGGVTGIRTCIRNGLAQTICSFMTFVKLVHLQTTFLKNGNKVVIIFTVFRQSWEN